MTEKKPTKNDWLTYSFTGLFYKNGNTPCRRELHIKKCGDIENIEPDLLVIMMNPGGSYPVNDETFENVKGIDESSFVPTEPDDTQWKVIKFMEVKNLQYALVLNLTDKCERESNALRASDKDFSMFQNAEEKELEKYLKSNMTVLIAWGCKDIFKPLIKNVICKLKGVKNVYGYLNMEDKHKGKHFYSHPLLRYAKKNEWLDGVQKLNLTNE